jgi:hypothetical protein
MEKIIVTTDYRGLTAKEKGAKLILEEGFSSRLATVQAHWSEQKLTFREQRSI